MRAIITFLLLVEVGSLASSQEINFHDSQRRVLSTTDVQRFLFAKLRLEYKSSVFGSICNTNSTGVLMVTGAFSPLEKGPIINKPESDYFEWYRSCVKSVLNQKVSDLSPEEAIHTFGTSLFAAVQMAAGSILPSEKSIAVTNHLSIAQIAFMTNWNTIKQETRKDFVRHLLADLVGPKEALEELRYIGPHSVYPGSPDNTEQLVEQLLAMPMTENPSAINVISAYKFYAFVILTNPTLLEN